MQGPMSLWREGELGKGSWVSVLFRRGAKSNDWPGAGVQRCRIS